MTNWTKHHYGDGESVSVGGGIIVISVNYALDGPRGYVARVGDLRSKKDLRFDTIEEAKAWALRVARRQLENALSDVAKLEAIAAAQGGNDE